jgi:hypothetical protein
MRLALLCLATEYMALVTDHVGMSTALRTAERPVPNRGRGSLRMRAWLSMLQGNVVATPRRLLLFPSTADR